MMDPELKARWIEALRSGHYRKGTTYLCRNENYCCLGVLADIENLFVGPHELAVAIKHISGSVAGLPRHISEQYGLQEQAIQYYSFKPIDTDWSHHRMLAYINDNSTTFDHVIEYIERYV